MGEMRQGISAELMLLNWNESANSGCKLIFEIAPDELEPFKALKTRAGKKVAGQRFAAVLVLIDDDESVVSAEQAPKPEPTKTHDDEPKKRGGFADTVGPRARLAVQWCDDPQFQAWVVAEFSEVADMLCDGDGIPSGPSELAKAIILEECAITSRKTLDEFEPIGAHFDQHFRIPYGEHLKKIGVAA